MGDMEDGSMTLGELEILLLDDGYSPRLGSENDNYRVFTKPCNEWDIKSLWVVTVAVTSNPDK